MLRTDTDHDAETVANVYKTLWMVEDTFRSAKTEPHPCDFSGLSIIAIERKGRFSTEVFAPVERTELLVDDVLFVDVFSPRSNILAACEQLGIEQLPLTGAYFSDRSQEIGMAEVMVTADSSLAGKSVIESGFRSRFRLSVVGLRHGQTTVRRDFLTEPLRVGDTLLLIGPRKRIAKLQADRSELVLLNLPEEEAEVLPVPGRSMHALICLVVMVGLMVSGIVPNVQAALFACLLMGALRCIDMVSAYRSIHWNSLILIVDMLPFSIALQKTGGVELAAGGLMAITGRAGDYAVLA